MTEALQNLRQRLERLPHAIAPLDFGFPVYVLWASEVGAGHDGVCGITGRCLDLTYKETLAGRWRGRDAAVIVNDAKVRELGEMLATAIVLHELAHVIDGRYQDHFAETETHVRPDDVAAMFETPPAECIGMVGQIALAQHGPRFTRALCHLSARAWRRFVLRIPAPLASGIENMSETISYQRSLGGTELNRVGAAIGDILKSPLPPAFRRLWNSDIAKVSAVLGGDDEADKFLLGVKS